MKKPGQLSGSCKMSANDAGMIMAVAPGRHSKVAVDRKFVCRVSKYCSDDKGVDQAGTCWPFMAELARCNGDHFKGTTGARPVVEFVAIARCPNAHGAVHCRTKHNILSGALMAELGAAPYFRQA